MNPSSNNEKDILKSIIDQYLQSGYVPNQYTNDMFWKTISENGKSTLLDI